MTAIPTSAAVSRPWLSFFDFFARDREAELRAQLLARGLPIIPNRLVFAHIAMTDRKNRPTIWHSIIHIIGYVFAILSLRLPLHFLTQSHAVFVGIAAFVLAAGGAIATFFGASSLYTLPFAVWMIEVFLFFLLVFFDDRGSNLGGLVGNAISRWHYYRPNAFEADGLPARIKDRLSILEETPGVRARILADTSDPFLVAVTGYGPFTKRLVVGAWATGDKTLDAY